MIQPLLYQRWYDSIPSATITSNLKCTQQLQATGRLLVYLPSECMHRSAHTGFEAIVCQRLQQRHVSTGVAEPPTPRELKRSVHAPRLPLRPSQGQVEPQVCHVVVAAIM